MTPTTFAPAALVGSPGPRHAGPAEVVAPANWQVVDFISDLHLDTEDASFNALAAYLSSSPAQALFVLGDFFEVWVGDDAALPGSLGQRCAQLFSAATHLTLFFMHGNRDFLLGSGFMQQCRATLLPDPTVLMLGKARYLLSHGDALCLQDTDYLAFRAQVRSPAWQHEFLARPLAERQHIARDLRLRSEARKQVQNASGEPFADVDAAAARQWLIAAQASTLVHGHTHQPATHALGQHAGQPLQRVVLSDWDAQASVPRREVLRLERGQATAQRIALA
ncbi:MAG: UDP-2,3-diacylglucosamine diphosphatase [Burkholderiales bacterium]